MIIRYEFDMNIEEDIQRLKAFQGAEQLKYAVYEYAQHLRNKRKYEEGDKKLSPEEIEQVFYNFVDGGLFND